MHSEERKLSREEILTAKVARKALYYNKNLKKNYKLKFNDLIPLRPLGSGLSPSMFNFIIGKKIKKDVKKFQIIKKNDFTNF